MNALCRHQARSVFQITRGCAVQQQRITAPDLQRLTRVASRDFINNDFKRIYFPNTAKSFKNNAIHGQNHCFHYWWGHFSWLELSIVTGRNWFTYSWWNMRCFPTNKTASQLQITQCFMSDKLKDYNSDMKHNYELKVPCIYLRPSNSCLAYTWVSPWNVFSQLKYPQSFVSLFIIIIINARSL